MQVKMSLCLYYLLSILTAVSLCWSQGFPASAVPQEESPLQIASLQATAPSPSPFGNRAAVKCNFLLRNVSDQAIMAYALRGGTQTSPEGQFGGMYIRSSSSRLTTAVLEPGAEMRRTATFVAREGTLKFEVDFVLLADGTAWGPDKGHMLREVQTSLTATRDTESWILSLLQSRGLEATEAVLKRDLSSEARDRPYMTPKVVIPRQ